MSPKSTEFPVVAICTYSIAFVALGVNPPNHTARVADEVPAETLFVVDKSPKSVASPVDAIVIYCMMLVSPVGDCGYRYPPANIPVRPE